MVKIIIMILILILFLNINEWKKKNKEDYSFLYASNKKQYWNGYYNKYICEHENKLGCDNEILKVLNN